MWILESLVGVLLAGVLCRALALPSLFPLISILPFFSLGSWPFVLGLVSFFLADLFNQGTPSPVPAFLLSILFTLVGLSLAPFLLALVSALEFTIPLLLLLGLGVVCFSVRDRGPVAGVFIFALVLVGYLLFVRWTIPLVLPAWLAGATGFIPVYEKRPLPLTAPLSAGIGGILLGLIPGLGPGLIGMIWSAARTWPLLVSTNLLFSLGLVSLAGNVRSVPAAVLAGDVLPDWTILLVFVLLGFVISFHLLHLFPVAPLLPVPSLAWEFLFLVFLLAWGGLASFFVWVLARAFRGGSDELLLPPSLGLLVLVSPIGLFYS